jgi:hypothetical protein
MNASRLFADGKSANTSWYFKTQGIPVDVNFELLMSGEKFNGLKKPNLNIDCYSLFNIVFWQFRNEHENRCTITAPRPHLVKLCKNGHFLESVRFSKIFFDFFTEITLSR